MSWMTKRIHSELAYSTVGMIEVLNEPVSDHNDSGNRYPAPGQDPGLVHKYYPGALQAVRDAEASLNVPDDRKLHVQFMSSKWGSGNPRDNSDVANDRLTAYDDHKCISLALGDDIMATSLLSCAVPARITVSLTARISPSLVNGALTSDVDVDPGNAEFCKKFFTAQQQVYEKSGMRGWVYWTWKTELNDPHVL